MAGDWIKFETATTDKPEVFEIAAALDIDPDAVIGKLLRIWKWFDQQTTDGNAPLTVRALLDRYSGVSGFCDAMENCGWLVVDGATLTLPNFTRHNGQTAKNRALTAKRVAKCASRTNGEANAKTNGASVSRALPREEKRREENNKSTPQPPKGGGGSDFTDEHWKAAPIRSRQRTTKKQCEDQWKKIKASERPTIAEFRDALAAWGRSEEWRKDDGEYVPALHRLIQRRFWESLPEKMAPPAKPGVYKSADPDALPATPSDFISWFRETIVDFNGNKTTLNDEQIAEKWREKTWRDEYGNVKGQPRP